MMTTHETRRIDRIGRLRTLFGVGAALGLTLLVALGSQASQLVEQAPLEVTVRESGPALLSYEITNRGMHPVRDVEIVVHHVFRWNDEFHPGTDNPSRATTQSVPVQLEPGETTQVSQPLVPPLEPREDGEFSVSVEVLRWTAVLPRR